MYILLFLALIAPKQIALLRAGVMTLTLHFLKTFLNNIKGIFDLSHMH